MKLNRYLQVLIALLAAALIIFVGVKTRNALEEYNYIGKASTKRDTIAVSGTGKVSATPNVAILHLGVKDDGKTVKAVQTQNTQKMNQIIAALKVMGIKPKDLQTSNYSIYPKYDYTNGRQDIVGYTVSQNIQIKVRKLGSIGGILAKAGELGMNQTSGVQFTIDDPQALKVEARNKAINDAKQKARDLAGTLGIHLFKVVSFSETPQNIRPPIVPFVHTMNLAAENVRSLPSPQIEAGSRDVVSNVTITYEVR